MPSAFVTVAAKNYLAQVRVLMSSVKKWHPEAERVVILVDSPTGYFEPKDEDFTVVTLDQIGLPQSKWFPFKYSILELSTAVKPWAFSTIFGGMGVDRLVYLDPDIKVYHHLDPVMRALDRCDIALTPHLMSRIGDEHSPSELDILRSGTYNLGFLGLTAGAVADSFLDWWKDKLRDNCVVDLSKGLFVDQRWIDLVPGLFEEVAILREPGLNVAYWNLHGRTVSGDGEERLVNGDPLYFFHYSGFDPQRPSELSKHQNRHRLEDLGSASRLVSEYREELLERGYREVCDWPYSYNAYWDGRPIPEIMRRIQSEAPGIEKEIEDPFSAEGFASALQVWNRVNREASGASGVTRLAQCIHSLRPDVREVMPDIFGPHKKRFLTWFIDAGRRDHQLPEETVEPVRQYLREGRSESTSSLQEVTQRLYGARPDLKSVFPYPEGEDRLSYLRWMLSYGRVEEGEVIDKDVVRELDTEWEQCLASRSIWTRWRCRLLLAACRASAAARQSRVSRMAGRGDSLASASPVVRQGRPRGEYPVSLEKAKLGINAIGYVNAEMGVGEVVRATVDAARSANLGTAVRRISTNGLHREMDQRLKEDSTNWYGVNVLHVNADQVPVAMDELDEDCVRRAKMIGYWCWEIEEFPDTFCPSFAFFDEIWTLSRFSQEAIATKSTIPVVRIPPSIGIREFPSRSRSDFGIPEEPFVFITAFDMLSVFERKNPLGVVAAFKAAFRGDLSSHLVLKVTNADKNPAAMQVLLDAMPPRSVTIIDEMLPRQDVYALFQVCDCLVSLHRAEGFGLTIAEAMYLGKPVIATSYSGNMDFTTMGNSFLVGYDLVQIPEDCDPYPATAHWAEPSLDDAVSQLRRVRHQQNDRVRIARAGQCDVRSQLSPDAAGVRIRKRLEILAG